MTARPIDTEALRKITDAATEGPWEAHGTTIAAITGSGSCQGCSGLVSPAHEPSCYWSEIAAAGEVDAEFIAAARTAIPALLDAIQSGVEHRKFLIGRLRGTKHRADNHEARAKAAEHRATRAEKWAALWKETARHQLGHIADRDDAHASCHWNSLVQADEVSAWQERAEQAEARIKAVEKAIEDWAVMGMHTGKAQVRVEHIRHALDGDA